MTKTQYDNPSVGCYVDESSGSADDCNRRTIEFAEDYGFVTTGFDPCDDEQEDYSEKLSEWGDLAVDFLNEQETRSFMYWMHEDNSLFLSANVEGAGEDCEFVTGMEGEDYPSDDYRGEWLAISDHGNATLYCRVDCKNKDGYEDVEIWGVV